MFNSSVKEGVITLTGRSGCKIANLQVDGNKTSYYLTGNGLMASTYRLNNNSTHHTIMAVESSCSSKQQSHVTQANLATTALSEHLQQ